MQHLQYILPILLIIPLIGAIGGSLLPHTFTGKWWGIVVSLATAFIGFVLALNYDWHAGGMQFVYQGPRFERLNTGIRLGVDSISIWLVLMTCVLHPLATTASFRSIRKRTKEHYAWFNLILFAMIGAFIAKDALLFYTFFEFSLVPLFFIVGIWGGPDRKAAAAKLFIYTFTGGVFTLMAILYAGLRAGDFDMTAMISFAQTSLTETERFWVLLGLLAGFCVKTPLFPLHTWLPLAHTEAPTAGSVDLAALVLKLGTYGLVRLALPMGLVGPNGTVLFPIVLNVLAVLCVIGVIYGALVAWAQTDIKKLIAYSSVSHLGFCVLGMLALNQIGVQASVFYMVNHGINTGALFLIVGMIYNRYHTRDVRDLSGLGKAMPKMAFFMVLFIMASIGLPGTNGFIGEFLTLLGAFTSDHLWRGYAVIATIGVILGAVYLLKLSGSILFGPLNYPPLPENAEDGHRTVHPKYVTGGDITGREVLVLTPLAILSIGLGVLPGPMLQSMVNPVREILAGVPHSQPAVAAMVKAPVPTAPVAVASRLPAEIGVTEQDMRPITGDVPMGPLDLVRVTVGDDAFVRRLNNRGELELHKGVPIPLAGVTPDAADAVVEQGLQTTAMAGEAVTLTVVESRQASFSIMGDVPAPGTYDLTGGERLSDALKRAEARDLPADRLIIVQRKVESGRTRELSGAAGRVVSGQFDVYLAPGDIIVASGESRPVTR